MKRFTITMYDVCQDFETNSWIAQDGPEADGIRAALDRLGLAYSEDDLNVPRHQTFNVLVCNSHQGSRSYKVSRTADEVRQTIDSLLGIGHSFPQDQATKLDAFFEGADESFDFADQWAEVSIQRCGEVPAAMDA